MIYPNEKEVLIQKLRDEGFTHVFEWSDKPGAIYEAHEHVGRVSFYITSGDLIIDFGGKKKNFKAGDRVDVEIGVRHSAVVGEKGCSFIVGEEIEGDA